MIPIAIKYFHSLLFNFLINFHFLVRRRMARISSPTPRFFTVVNTNGGVIAVTANLLMKIAKPEIKAVVRAR